MWQTSGPSLAQSEGGLVCVQVARKGQKGATCYLALSDWCSLPKERSNETIISSVVRYNRGHV